MGKRFLYFTFKIPQLKGNSSKILFPFIISKKKGDIRAILERLSKGIAKVN